MGAVSLPLTDNVLLISEDEIIHIAAVRLSGLGAHGIASKKVLCPVYAAIGRNIPQLPKSALTN